MPESRSQLSLPTYGVDLRALVDRAFAAAAPVPASPIPGGPIQERIENFQPPDWSRLVGCAGADAPDDDPTEVWRAGPVDYWELALPHRVLVTGPLLDIASAELDPEQPYRTERRLLSVYYRRYRCVPLPPVILGALRVHAAHPGGESLPAWLDEAAAAVVDAASMEEAARKRAEFRLVALRRGASGAWDNRTTAVAEVMTDVLLLCRAAREDVARALEEAGRFGGSVARAVAARSDAGDLHVEAILPALLRPLTLPAELSASECDRLKLYLGSRARIWQEGVVFASADRRSIVQIRHRERTDRPPPDQRNGADRDRDDVDDRPAAETYRDLVRALNERIIDRPDLVRRLALVGIAHLRGVIRQRVLLCGPTGSGKTHAARALAEALGRPHLQVDASDLTGTGWRGAELHDILTTLGNRAKGSLNGSVLVLDEVDKCRIDPTAEGNSREAKVNLQSSLLALLDGQPVTPDGGSRQLDTSAVLVIGTGAFGNRFAAEPPTTEELVRWGWLPEFAARWGERLCLSPPDRSQAIALLRSSDRSVQRRLGPLLEALGIEVEVPEAALAYAADRWLSSGVDFRTAAEWLAEAVRRRIIGALESGSMETIVLTPDDLPPSR